VKYYSRVGHLIAVVTLETPAEYYIYQIEGARYIKGGEGTTIEYYIPCGTQFKTHDVDRIVFMSNSRDPEGSWYLMYTTHVPGPAVGSTLQGSQ
jgi:hypothetical protein